MKVLFCTKKIQKMGRVALTETLLRNAGIQVGDTVNLYFDASTKAIILEPLHGETEPVATTVVNNGATKARRNA